MNAARWRCRPCRKLGCLRAASSRLVAYSGILQVSGTHEAVMTVRVRRAEEPMQRQPPLGQHPASDALPCQPEPCWRASSSALHTPVAVVHGHVCVGVVDAKGVCEARLALLALAGGVAGYRRRGRPLLDHLVAGSLPAGAPHGHPHQRPGLTVHKGKT